MKIIDAAGHSRLDRETALAPDLPAGLTALLLGSGLCRLGTREVRYACYARVPGAAPGMGMPGVDGATARLLAEEAVQRLGGLYSWMPGDREGQTLMEPLDHGGFVSQAALFAEVENLAVLDRDGTVLRHLLDGLTAIAQRAVQLSRPQRDQPAPQRQRGPRAGPQSRDARDVFDLAAGAIRLGSSGACGN